MPRPPPPPAHETTGPDPTQQALQRLFVAYNQCVTRANHIEDRLEQFRAAVHRDATDLAITVHRTDHGVTEHRQDIRRLTESLEQVHLRLKSLDEHYQKIVQHERHVNQTIDRNTHSQTASICALIAEQADLRKLVTELAQRLDQSQDNLSTPQGDTSTSALLDLGDLRTKVLRLTEQNTTLEGEVSFLKNLSERVEALGDQIVKWNFRLPDLSTEESDEKVPTAIEVREELTELTHRCQPQ